MQRLHIRLPTLVAVVTAASCSTVSKANPVTKLAKPQTEARVLRWEANGFGPDRKISRNTASLVPQMAERPARHPPTVKANVLRRLMETYVRKLSLGASLPPAVAR